MIKSILISLGTNGGDPLEGQDGSYYDHDVYLATLAKRVQAKYPDAIVTTRFMGRFGTGLKFYVAAVSNVDAKDEYENVAEADACVEDCESMREKAWSDACDDQENWTAPHEEVEATK